MCIVSGYANDGGGAEIPGRTLWEALRGSLESTWAGVLDNLRDDPEHQAAYLKSLADLARLRERILAYATTDRPEIGAAYGAKYNLRGLRKRHALAETPEGMGIIAAPKQYKPLSLPGHIGKVFAKKKSTKALVAEALDLARGGHPATALWLGRHCWSRSLDEEAYALLDAAYTGLDRPYLREVLALHRAHRDLASVDVLED